MPYPSIAPNDPLFWLHHANVDRLWDLWQVATNYRWPPTLTGMIAGIDPWLQNIDGVVRTLNVNDVINTYKLHYYIHQVTHFWIFKTFGQKHGIYRS